MFIEQLTLEKFHPYDRLDFDPKLGVTLVTGINGSGKSSVIDGIAWVLYDETLRDAKRTGKGSLTAMVGDRRVQVTRSRSGLRHSLALTIDGKDCTGATPTETQERIANTIGTWEAFGTTRFFSREFLVRFGSAKDSDRKALLEELLGLDRFDRALKIVRDDLKAQREVVATAQLTASNTAVLAQRARDTYDRLAHALTTEALDADALAADLQAAEAEVARLEALNAAHETRRGNIARALSGARRAVQGGLALASGQKGRLSELMRNQAAPDVTPSACPACGQPLPPEALAALQKRRADDERQRQAAIAKLQQEIQASTAALTKATAEQTKLEKDDAEAASAARAARDELRPALQLVADIRVKLSQATQAQEQVALASEELDAATDEADMAQLEHHAAVRELNTLEATERVFALQGARVALLAKALGTIEDATNEVLKRIGPGLSVSISSTSTDKSGKQTDKLSVFVHGAANGTGNYQALSSGERTRFDVALLLGLASLSPAQGFISFDEVFDTLDEDGVARVAEYLKDIGTSRQVIVVSHSSDVRLLLNESRHYLAHRPDPTQPAQLQLT